jgi:hypothetical protein
MKIASIVDIRKKILSGVHVLRVHWAWHCYSGIGLKAMQGTISDTLNSRTLITKRDLDKKVRAN